MNSSDQPTLIKIKTISAGLDGDLSFVESDTEIPFSIRRVYYIHGIKHTTVCGYHAHKALHQCLIAVHGSVVVKFEGRAGKFTFHLNKANEGILIPPGYWREMHDLAPDSVVMVFASERYIEDDYIRDYGQFLEWIKDGESVSSVPYLDFARYKELWPHLNEAIWKVMKSGNFINGTAVRNFEQAFSGMHNVHHTIGTGNGLDAL